MKTTASVSWATRWMLLRSVFRRSWPKFESHELVRSTGQRSPIGWFVFGSLVPRLRFFAMIVSSIERSARRSLVVAES